MNKDSIKAGDEAGSCFFGNLLRVPDGNDAFLHRFNL